MGGLSWSLLLLLCGLSLGLPAGPAHAGGFNLRITLWRFHSDSDLARRNDGPQVGRYEIEHGEGFVLDRSVNPPLLRFEGSPEIWILRPQPAPRGDTIYRNDLGQPVLRATKLGGLTLYTEEIPDGAAAAFAGEAPSLRLPPLMSASALYDHIMQSGVRSLFAIQKRISFSTVDDATPQTASLIAETAIVTAEAITRVARKVDGRTELTRISHVLLARGQHPDAQLSGGSLTVTYASTGGVGAWPSSERIMQVIEAPTAWKAQVTPTGAHTGH